jgi:hypothetical protein
MKRVSIFFVLVFFSMSFCGVLHAKESQYGVMIENIELQDALPISYNGNVRVTFRNTGNVAISSEDNIFLSYHWYDENNEPVIFDGLRTELGESVAPGERGTVFMHLVTPDVPGSYTLEVDFVQEEVQWFSDIDTSFAKRVNVRVDDLFHAEISMKSSIHRMHKSKTKQVEVVVTNTGTEMWEKNREIALSYHWLNENNEMVIRDGIRTQLTEQVRPRDTVIIEAMIKSPDQLGTYYLQWDMVKEGDFWFSEINPESTAKYKIKVEYNWEKFMWAILFVALLVLLFRLVRTSK